LPRKIHAAGAAPGLTCRRNTSKLTPERNTGGIRVKVSFAAAAVAMLAVAFFAGQTLAEEKDDKRTPIDCSKIDMQFTGEQFEVECTEFKGEQIHQSDGSAQVQTKVLTADSNRTADWLAALDSRILGSLAIRRIGLEENIHDYFSKLPIKNWKSLGDVQGFEAAAFESAGSDDIQDCVAFQRFYNRRYNGYSSWLVGVACSSDGKDAALKALAGFSGPG
jgi:hypothetical protein